VLLKSQNILNYNESKWINMNGSPEYIPLREQPYG